MPRRKTEKAETSPLKLMLWTAIAAILFGLIGAGEYAEDTLRVARNKLHTHPASGDIVLVAFDDASLREVGRWPWPRGRHAKIIESLTEAGAKEIFYDISFFGPTNERDDSALEDALKSSGRVVLPIKAKSGLTGLVSDDQNMLPLPRFAAHSRAATISVPYNYQNATWRIPLSLNVGGNNVPSFSALLAGTGASSNGSFVPDYSIDPKSFKTIGASDLLAGRYRDDAFRGKDVIVGITSDAAGDQYFIPGHGKMGGMFVHAIGAETLKADRPKYFGWLPALALALLAAAIAVRERRPLRQSAILGLATTTLLTVPVALEANLWIVDITPALLVMIIVGSHLARRQFRARGLINSISGLPNLAALRDDASGRDRAIIAARVLNYAEIVATLPADRERQLIEQITSRLTVGSPSRRLYHGDDGLFAWFGDARQPFSHHLDALYALFRTPARMGEATVDLAIAFGVELGSRRSLSSRLASALVAAEEAAHDGLKWKIHDPDTLTNASWKLSMLSQLDDAVDKGEVWVAFQPKLDIVSRKLIGAEALARWTHPEKGPIAASEFVAAAEQHDRIAKLTDFVLENAIAAAATLNRKSPGFGVAVNLSARLLSDAGFTLRLAAQLARHRLSPELLTLELTETAALTGSGAATEMLAAIRRLGVGISIDDYGTGLSTLEYLKKIPANEIKIDQSFVKSMLDNRSDRVMVQSTITLAHALGRKVVAEGVERREILDALIEMGCDIAQGFIVGRPMSLESLIKRVGTSQRTRVA